MDDKSALLASAEQGDSNAQFLLGQYYAEQEDDMQQAEKWWREAAQQNHGKAKMELGSLACFAGNFQDAEKWWRQAAEHEELSSDALACLHVLAERDGSIPFHEFVGCLTEDSPLSAQAASSKLKK